MIEEVISTEPVQEQPYKKKVYDILSSNFDDFKLGEQDFYKKLSTDKTYAGKVHDVLIENFSDFKKPKNEFIDSLTFVEPVKKKDQIGNLSGEVSSPIQSKLPKGDVTEWYKQTMPDAMFVKSISDNTRLTKPREMAEDVLYKAAAPIREAKKKADTEIAIKNTAENYFKNNKIDAPVGSPLYNKQVAELKTKVENGDAVLGVDKTNDKLGLKKTTGFWSSLQSGFNNAINANNEAAAFVEMSPEQKVKFVKDKSKTQIGKEGYIGEAPNKLGFYGEFLGGAGPMVAKTITGTTVGAGLAALAPETGGLSMAGLPAVMAWAFNAQDMASQGAQKEIMRRYEMIKARNTGISDVDAMKEASSGQTLGEIAGLAENTAFMMPASRVINPAAKLVLRSGIENTLKSAIHVGAVVSGTEAGKKVVAGVTSKYGETPQEILSNSALDFAENATVGGLLHISTMGAVGLLNLPKVVQSGIKYALKDVPKQDIDNVLKANVNIGNIPPDVAEKVSSDIDGYKEAADKAMPGLSPEAEASQIGLIQKKNKLVEESKTKDDSVKPVYKEQIESIDNKINDLNKGKPVYDVETDELTGNKYNKDKSTEYISIEELPKEEVKPTKVKVEDVTSKEKNEEFDTPTLKSPLSNYEKLYVPRNVVEEAYKNDKDNNPVFGKGNQSLNRIIERGGYSIEELNKLYPNWKESKEEVKPTEVKETAPIIDGYKLDLGDGLSLEIRKTDEGVRPASSFMIKKDGKQIGYINIMPAKRFYDRLGIPADINKNDVIVDDGMRKGVEIFSEENKKKGYGTKAYIGLLKILENESISSYLKGGRVLSSPQWSQSIDSYKLWESLYKKGLAKIVGTTAEGVGNVKDLTSISDKKYLEMPGDKREIFIGEDLGMAYEGKPNGLIYNGNIYALDAEAIKRASDIKEAAPTKEVKPTEVNIENKRAEELDNLKKGIPAMITKKLESDLKQYGFTDKEINKMTPIVANESLINAKYDAELSALKKVKPVEIKEKIKVEEPVSTQKVKIPGTKESKPIPLSDFTLEKEGERTFTKRIKKDEGGVSGVEPLNQFKLNQGMDAYGNPYPRVHIILDNAEAEKYQATLSAGGKKVAKYPEFRDAINKIAKANRSKTDEVVLDFRKSEIDLLLKKPEKVKPTEIAEIPLDLEEKGEPIESTLEAERRRSNGERIFAITEQDETPVEVTSVEMLRNYTPDQLIAYKTAEIIKNKELQENKLILQNGTKKQGNGKDTGAANGGEMGGLEPSGKGVEGGLGAPSRYVVGKSDRVVRDVTTVKKISIPDSEAAEIKKVLPNAIFDDSFSEINSAEQFHKAISKSIKGNKHSSSVFVYPIEEYKNSRLFLTNDGKAGVAITKDGDIISVFSYGEGKNRVAQLLVNAVKDGGVSLDHYDTRLTNIYSQFGFVPVARVKFDRAEAPKTWDYDLYKDYNNGEPDVIAMAYNGGDPNTLYKRVGKFGNVNDLLKKTPYVNTWEQAKKLQQEFVNKIKSDLEPSIEKDIKTQIEDFGVPKEDVEPVNAMLSKIHENLKKAGLTATNTLSEWVGIGKGTKEKGALYQPTVYGNSGIVKRPSFDKTSADKAIKSGRVKVISPKDSLEDLTFAITHWDDLFVGDIYHDGKKIGSFDGGVFYPLNGGEKGKMGASVNPQSAGAFSTQSNRSLFKNNGIKLPESFEEGTFIVEKGANKNEWVVTNKAGEKVNITMPDNPKPGVIVIGKGDNLKHKSSLSAKVGFVNTLLSYAKGKEGYDGLINAIKSVYSIGNTRNADSVIELFNNYLKSGRMADGQTMSEAKTSYENFRAALIKDANQIVTSMMRDMGYTDAEYFDGTQLKKGIYKATGKGIDKMFADIGQEDFLKGLKTGDAYAALKVTSPVFFEKDLGHPSYPFAIKTVDGSPVNIDIFDKTFRTFGENQGIEGRLPKEGQTATEGFGVTTTTKPSYTLKKDIDLSHPSSNDLSGALGQYESIRRFHKEGAIIPKKGEYDYALKQKANAQYRIESGKNIIEALREFNKAKDKGKAVVAITHEIMHPTVVEIISGAKENNEIGKKYTETIVNEFNKATSSDITVDELIKGNDEFKNGKTTKKYRDVQEFIAESWEKYHTQGAKGFSAEFQKVLKTITEAFKSVYNSLTGKELTPELKRMFDDILGKSEFKAKKKILSEDVSEKQTVVTLPEGADDSYIKMANVVNDAFVGNKFGLDALDQITSKLEDTNLENVIQKVKDKIKLNPNLARETRERLLTTKQGNEFDQAVLMYDLARLKGRENELQQEIINTKNPKKIQEYQNEILQVQNEMMDNAMANKQIGRTASTIFRLRQLWVNKELTILDMMDEYKASKGIDELTPEQEQEVKDAYNQIKESRAKLEEAKLDLEKSREETAKLMIENQKLKELQEKSNEIKKAERAEKTSETIKKSNERVNKSLDNLKKLGGQATAGFDPKIAVELSKIAAEKVYQGIVKFDELVQNVLEDIKDVLPDFTKEDVINHILTRVNKAGQLEPMLLSAQYNNIKKSLDKSKGTLRERVTKYEEAQKEVARQQFKWQEGRRQDMMGNEPIVEKIGDKLLRFQRFAVLSYPITMVKLAAVVAHQLIALKPLKFAIGKLVYALTPKSIREKQSIWGDPKWSSIAKYYSEWIRNFSSTNFKEIMSGVDTKELLYGRPIMYDELNASGSFLEIPGRSHGFIKSFIKNPEFAYAHEQQMVYNLTKMAEITEKLDEPSLTKKQKKALQEEYDNYDVTNEDVIEKINRLALLHAKWAILMNDSKFVDKFRQFTQNTGLVGKIAQSELPIVKIPVNWVGRAFATKYGIIRSFLGKSETETKGKGKLPGLGGTSFPGIAELIFKGTENLTESQAELLGKSLQLGTMGIAFYALGYYNYKNIKKNDDGSYEVMGFHVPKVLVHIPEYESIISGAETAHKKKEKDQSFIKSYIEADAEIAANNPFLNFLQYGASVQLGKLVTDVANPKKKDVDFVDKATDIVTKKITDMVEPGMVKTAATTFDTKEGKGFHPMGEVIKRKPSGETLDRVWEQFELGIPGLRQNVSREEKAKRINEITKRLQSQKYDSLRGKIIENLKKIPN